MEPIPLRKEWTELDTARSRFQDALYGAVSGGESHNFEFLQWTASDLAEAASDPLEKAQAKTLSRLLKRLIRGYRVTRPSTLLTQTDAEQVRNLCLSLVRRLIPRLDNIPFAGMTDLEYPLDFLLPVFYLSDLTDQEENPSQARKIQEICTAFLATAPRLVQVVYLAYAPHLAEAEPDLPPYHIGDEWLHLREQVEPLARQTTRGEVRDFAQQILIVLAAWQERGQPTAWLVNHLYEMVGFLLVRLAPDGRQQLPPSPLPDPEAEYRLRPFTPEDEERYRWLDARQAAYDAATARGDTSLPKPGQPPLSDAECHRYDDWRKQDEVQYLFRTLRANREEGWAGLQKRAHYWQQVRQRHREQQKAP